MITFTQLGNIGRLGNHLFQIASTIGIAISNDQSFVFPEWTYAEYYRNPIPQIEREYLLSLDLKLCDATKPFHYQPVSLEARYDWDLNGYFQSEKYFKHCEHTIRDYFTLKDSHLAYLKSKYKRLLEANCCSISVRRGDYLQFQHYHPVLPVDYFHRATALFPADTIYLVFSDDIDWCKRQFVGDKFFFIEEPRVLLSLHLMSFCRNHIIPNSTFGWWGAWLNGNSDKKVIAPSRWFGEGYADLDTKDLIPEGWLKI
jgi:hypothetical protein